MKFLGSLFKLVFFVAFFALSANADISVSISGPAGTQNQVIQGDSGNFDFNVSLQKNSQSTFTVTAKDQYGNSASKDVRITQLSFEKIAVASIQVEPLPPARIRQLVNDGVININDPSNFNVSQFTIVLTVGSRPVPISIPIAVPIAESPVGEEVYKVPSGFGGGGAPPPPPTDVVIFEVHPPPLPGLPPPPAIPGVIVIDGRIKTLKEFFSAKFLLMNTSGIFTLKDVTAQLEFPNGGLSPTLPVDGLASLGDILPGDGTSPGQALKEFIFRGDDKGTQVLRVNFGGKVGGAGLLPEEEVPFNGSAQASVEVKGPPEFRVRVTHPDDVVANVPYELAIELTNIGDSAALYTSLDLDLGPAAELLNCSIDQTTFQPNCTKQIGPATRNFGDIMPGQTIREVFAVNPLVTGPITSCMGISDQNISLEVFVGNLGCVTGKFTPQAGVPSGVPTVSMLPFANAAGISTESPVVALFSEKMALGTISTGQGGSLNVYNKAGDLLPGTMTFTELNNRTVVIWQFQDGITNRLPENSELSIRVLPTIRDLQGNTLFSEWNSKFTTTGTNFNDFTPPAVTLSVEFPVNPNNVFPGQLVKLNAYTSDQGSGVQRVELRMDDLDVPGVDFQLRDQKNVVSGDKPPFIFLIDSKLLVPGHTYQLKTTAYDFAGNSQDATLALFIAGSALPPTITLPASIDPVLKGVAVSITPEAVTGGAYQVEYFLDGSSFQLSSVTPYQVVIPTLNLAEGTHTVNAVATDGLNQTGQASVTFDVLANSNAPQINWSSPSEGQDVIIGSVLPVNVSINDVAGIKGVNWYFDNPSGAPFASGVTNFTINTAQIPLGTYRIYAIATNNLDLANLPTDSGSYRTINIVPVPPEPAPPAPTILNITPAVGGSTTVSGTTAPNRRVDLANQDLPGVVLKIYSNSLGNFQGAIDGAAGNTITATAFNAAEQLSSVPATGTVPPLPNITSISVSPNVLNFVSFNVVSSLQVTGTFSDSSTQNVTNGATFSSSDPTVASVSGAGQVVPLKNGTATITTSFGGQSDTVQVTVNVFGLSSIQVSPTQLTFNAVGQNSQLSVVGTYTDNTVQDLTGGTLYSTGNPAVANVTAGGVVTAVGPGSTTITASRSGVAPTTVQVTVNIADSVPPTVQIVSPANGDDVERGAVVSVSTQAGDGLSGVRNVIFSASGQASAGETRNVPGFPSSTTQAFSFAVPQNAAIGGIITVTVTAEDGVGNISNVATINLDVVDQTAPSVSILNPAPNTPYNYGDTISLDISANDLVGVTQIRYQVEGSFSASGQQNFAAVSGNRTAGFVIPVPFGLSDPDVMIRAFARDGSNNEREAIAVPIVVTTADITPPDTQATAVTNPGTGSTTTVTYIVNDGLTDLDHVELYFRRNGIGTFNRYTDPDNAAFLEGHFSPQSGAMGTILFKSDRMGGDGSYEFYTIGVDTAGNREAPPTSANLVTPDQSVTINAGISVTVINSATAISASNTTFDGQNLKIDGATVTIDGTHVFGNMELLNGAVLNHSETDNLNEFGFNLTLDTLTVDATSSINVDGRGYLGGIRPGNPSTLGMGLGNVPLVGPDAGGSYGGLGASLNGGTPNPVYGALNNPVELGSGGSARGGWFGGDGGGRVRINSVNVVADGLISANGTNGQGNFAGCGSGGSININTATLSGTGMIRANGGSFQTSGGGGRIAVFHIDMATKDPALVTALGGVSSISGANGTVFLQKIGDANGNLVVNGQPGVTSFTNLPIPPGFTFDNIILQNGALVNSDDLIDVANELRIRGNSILSHSIASESGLRIKAKKVVIEAGSRIDVTGDGYRGGLRSGNASCAGETLNGQLGSGFDSGGSYGGYGGRFNSGAPDSVYGHPRDAIYLGSGGPCRGGWYGGNGGGYVDIEATDTIQVDGEIRADGDIGQGNFSGSGSGGSIRLKTGIFRGQGVISANGGALQTGGGGGRIYVDYAFIQQAPNDFSGLRSISAFGGRGVYRGSAGTVLFHRQDQAVGDLYIDDNENGTTTSPIQSELTPIGLGTVQAVTPDTLTLDGGVTLLPNALVGLQINPNVGQSLVYTVVANTVNEVTVDTNSKPPLSSVTTVGSQYVGDYTFDNVRLQRGGNLQIADRLHATSELLLSESSRLTHRPVSLTYFGNLDLQTDTLTVESGSMIDVDGRGYLGGLIGGNGCSARTIGNALSGASDAGGSYGGLGAKFNNGAPNSTYGSASEPVDFGSGGPCRGGWLGGNGGGYVRIAAQDIILDGEIRSNGFSAQGNFAGSGSGGSINIRTNTLSGSGFVRANGTGTQLGGGGGRVSIRYGNTLGLPLANINALGGLGSVSGGNGTVFLKSALQGNGDLIIDGLNNSTPSDSTEFPAGMVADNIRFINGARIVTTLPISALQRVELLNGSQITHPVGFENGVEIIAPQIYVDSTSSIDVNGRGYRGGLTSGNASCFGETLGAQSGASSEAGGSYGGPGYLFNTSSVSNPVYGTPQDPSYLGSGGSCRGGWFGGNGGGRVTLTASNKVEIDGFITANGNNAQGNFAGSGSGGSVKINAHIFEGTGAIEARGGELQTGGGGGRIAAFFDQLGADNFNNLLDLRAFGGAPGSNVGGAGTLFLQASSQPLGDLYIDNNLSGNNNYMTWLTEVGFGKIQGLTSDTITTDGNFNYLPGALVGVRINPNLNQNQLFTVISNTSGTITVDISSGPTLTAVASIGDDYAGVYSFDNVYLRRGGVLTTTDKLVVSQTVQLASFSAITHREMTSSSFVPRVDLTTGTLIVDSNSRIDVTGRGYLGGMRPGNGSCSGLSVNNAFGAPSDTAGSFGGLGAAFGSATAMPIYGDQNNPADLGSGGGCRGGWFGGDGGGWIKIVSGSAIIDGSIVADGTVAQGNFAGSGSGGTVNIQTANLSGSGSIRANGGGLQVGGGGGRVFVSAATNSFTAGQYSAAGGAASIPGQAGTVVIQ